MNYNECMARLAVAKYTREFENYNYGPLKNISSIIDINTSASFTIFM